MKIRAFYGCLLVLSIAFISQAVASDTPPVFYDDSMDQSTAQEYLYAGVPLVTHGESSLIDLYQPQLTIENRSTGEFILVASGLWVQNDEQIEHQLMVYDYSMTERDNESMQQWVDTLTQVETPSGYQITGIITEIYHHEPYGVLETQTEVLKLVEDNLEYDWYDVTVYQSLTPGANYTSSSWEWNWLLYTMNGSLGSSNIYLSDYDAPYSEELPQGPFGFLWRLLGFDLRKYIPWLFPPEPRVTGVDMSDFSIELFRARYEAPNNYRYRNEPLEKRHHYVIRIEDGESPVFWHQTQAEYTQADDFAQVPFITPPLASGYIVVNR